MCTWTRTRTQTRMQTAQPQTFVHAFLSHQQIAAAAHTTIYTSLQQIRKAKHVIRCTQRMITFFASSASP